MKDSIFSKKRILLLGSGELGKELVIERIIWAMIGVFFLGAISSSITSSIRSQNWFGRKFSLNFFKDKKITDNTSSQPSGDGE